MVQLKNGLYIIPIWLRSDLCYAACCLLTVTYGIWSVTKIWFKSYWRNTRPTKDVPQITQVGLCCSLFSLIILAAVLLKWCSILSTLIVHLDHILEKHLSVTFVNYFYSFYPRLFSLRKRRRGVSQFILFC